jgi:uncharacterized surface protein with fasciclin (FAS1) repeats
MKLKTASFALILSVLISAMPAAAGSAQKDIVDTAVAAGTFNTLATALQAAGLADTLKGKGPFTVFAPQTKPSASCRQAPLSRFSSPRTRKS